ncbi:MAG: MerC domain-containing protein [Chloroflexi bacterium]|nr:MerC domain-containing protein [Chloroflexota bacterium]
MLKNISLDRFGSIASTVCAIHCALSPILFGLLPLIGGANANERWLEPLFVLAAIGLAVVALARGYAVHHRRSVVALFVLGFAGIVAGKWIVAGARPVLENGTVVAGSLILVRAHRRNHSACMTCLVCNSKDTPECD